jgi:hypothetical protein
VLGKLNGVANQIDNNLAQPARIPNKRLRDIRGGVEDEFESFGTGA